MLLGQNRRRHQHRDLVAIVNRFERRASPARSCRSRRHRTAGGPSVASAPCRLDGGDRRELIGRFHVGEGSIEFALPCRVAGEANAGRNRASRLQVEHVGRQVGHRLARPPFAATTSARRYAPAPAGSSFSTDVFLHQLDLRRRHKDLRVAVELEHQVLFGRLPFSSSCKPR